MARRRSADPPFDRELRRLAPAERWREWMARVEAVLFASAGPVPRRDLARVVGEEVVLEALIEDLSDGLAERPYELAAIGEGWMLRTRRRYADAIRAAARLPETGLPELREADLATLAAIARHQPATRAELAEMFGRQVPPETIARLRAHELIAPGPRSPRPGSPQTFVTTEVFLATFGLHDLDALQEAEEESE